MATNSIGTITGPKCMLRCMSRAFCLCVWAILLAMVLPSPLSAFGQVTGSDGQVLSNPLPHPTSLIPVIANRTPDANDHMEMKQQKLKRASYEAANAERKRQLDLDSAMLLKLASELKAQIDIASRDTLSLSAVRKAEEIERLAHSVQLKMKLTVGAD